MRKLYWRFAGLAIAAGTVSACGGGSDSPAATTPPTVTPAAKLEDQFGANFGTAYRNSPNTEAAEPTATGLAPLSLTTEPVPI